MISLPIPRLGPQTVRFSLAVGKKIFSKFSQLLGVRLFCLLAACSFSLSLSDRGSSFSLIGYWFNPLLTEAGIVHNFMFLFWFTSLWVGREKISRVTCSGSLCANVLWLVCFSLAAYKFGDA
ncbi:hypothetical protein P3X46_026573 [Hevea brasiliensis]|uniref:Uncharacterized protein n=1 Tax=Hevea brasiliensis TaxID=3981 RepID=A0ABQ9KYI8_HEVBR|nr:hypothetical protein P3X46_026573 [Hevea brasiliensis]